MISVPYMGGRRRRGGAEPLAEQSVGHEPLRSLVTFQNLCLLSVRRTFESPAVQRNLL
jgi:hypothetical protein